jgi:hypothetical protein
MVGKAAEAALHAPAIVQCRVKDGLAGCRLIVVFDVKHAFCSTVVLQPVMDKWRLLAASKPKRCHPTFVARNGRRYRL